MASKEWTASFPEDDPVYQFLLQSRLLWQEVQEARRCKALEQEESLETGNKLHKG